MRSPFFFLTPLICLSFAFALSAADPGKKYICPPCGCTADDRTFDKPGNCPQCGMALIEKSAAPPQEKTAPVTVAVLLFNGAEIIDYAGPWEAFGEAGFKVFTVAEKAEPIASVFGQKSIPDYTFGNSPAADILLVPGGGINEALASPALIKWVQDNAQRSKHVMSVCNGAFILAKAGLLDGLAATTVNHGIDQLAQAAPKVRVVRDQRYVDNGKVITTAGLSSGIDGAFHLIEKIKGRGTAQTVALGMEYNWNPDGTFVRAAMADRFFPDFGHVDGEMLSNQGDRDHWEARALLAAPNSAQGILDLLGNKVRSATPHIRGDVTMTSADPAKNGRGLLEWKFTDEQGQKWNGSGAVEPGRSSGKFILTLKLARAAG